MIKNLVQDTGTKVQLVSRTMTYLGDNKVIIRWVTTPRLTRPIPYRQ